MKTALVFGASGQIGAPLLERLGDAGWRVLAVSREARSDAPGRHWLQGDFARMPALPAAVDAVFSCGPLDLFARWYEAAACSGRKRAGTPPRKRAGRRPRCCARHWCTAPAATPP